LRRFDLLHSCHTRPEDIPDVGLFLAHGLDVTIRYRPFYESPKPTPWQGIER
jgi:hypothetical protein